MVDVLRFRPATAGLVIEHNRRRVNRDLRADEIASRVVLSRATPNKRAKRYRSLEMRRSHAALDFIGEMLTQRFFVDTLAGLWASDKARNLKFGIAVADSSLDDMTVLLGRHKCPLVLLGRLGSGRRLGLGSRRVF